MNQGVFTYLIDNLGVKDVQFEELISLDPSELQQLRLLSSITSHTSDLCILTPTSSPVYGVIFLFKYPTGETRPKDVPHDGTYDLAAAENTFFASQVIQNACGTQALLSVLLNKEDTLDIGPQLKEFKDFTMAFPPEVKYPHHIPSPHLNPPSY